MLKKFYLKKLLVCAIAIFTILLIYVIPTNEEEKLKTSVNKYIQEYNMDMVLVTVKYHTKSRTKVYAEDFYDYNGFGIGNTYDGIIFVIDFTFGYTDIYISTTGQAIRMYDDYRINNMLDNIAVKKDSGYYNFFMLTLLKT